MYVMAAITNQGTKISLQSKLLWWPCSSWMLIQTTNAISLVLITRITMSTQQRHMENFTQKYHNNIYYLFFLSMFWIYGIRINIYYLFFFSISSPSPNVFHWQLHFGVINFRLHIQTMLLLEYIINRYIYKLLIDDIL